MNHARQISFIYPKPVSGLQFIGRRKEINILASNLMNGQSTAFYGAPGSGRSSLLYFFKDRTNLHEIFGEDATQFCCVFRDLKITDPDHRFDPKEFWQTILSSLQKDYADPLFQEVSAQEATAEDAKVAMILDHFTRNNRKLVLLIDNFSLLYDERAHPQGELPSHFHHRLRNFAVQYPLVIFCTTDRFLTELDNSDGIWFSPLINIFQERACAAFGRADLAEFNSKTLLGSGKAFLNEDLDFVHRLTAGFPILCQMAAEKLFEHREKLDWKQQLSKQEQEQLFDEIYRQGMQALSEIWKSLSPDERIMLMYILLAHRGGREVNNMSYKISKDDPDLFGFKGWRVNRLKQFQIVKQNEDRFEIASPLFEQFIINEMRQKQFPQLEDRKTRFLVFSQAQFNRFKKTVEEHEALFARIALSLFENWMSRN